jgi:hypothetical protein
MHLLSVHCSDVSKQTTSCQLLAAGGQSHKGLLTDREHVLSGGSAPEHLSSFVMIVFRSLLFLLCFLE